MPPAPLRQKDTDPVWAKLNAEGNPYGVARGRGGVTAKPRDLSGANTGGMYLQHTQEGGARVHNNAATGRQNLTMNSTQKPDFVPSLTIPSEGMVNGKLNVN